jgi:hypothetical protein
MWPHERAETHIMGSYTSSRWIGHTILVGSWGGQLICVVIYWVHVHMKLMIKPTPLSNILCVVHTPLCFIHSLQRIPHPNICCFSRILLNKMTLWQIFIQIPLSILYYLALMSSLWKLHLILKVDLECDSWWCLGGECSQNLPRGRTRWKMLITIEELGDYYLNPH